MSKEGVRIISIDWTLGRYDTLVIFEAPDDKEAMRIALGRSDYLTIEDLVAIPAEEARKLVE